MKKTLIITIIISFALANANNVTPEVTHHNLIRIEQAYVDCLNLNNIGVVESAIYCVIKMQHYNPDYSFIHIERELDRLSRYGETPNIRFKATVASLYLSNPDLMSRIKLIKFQDSPEFWGQLVENTYPPLSAGN